MYLLPYVGHARLSHDPHGKERCLFITNQVTNQGHPNPINKSRTSKLYLPQAAISGARRHKLGRRLVGCPVVLTDSARCTIADQYRDSDGAELRVVRSFTLAVLIGTPTKDDSLASALSASSSQRVDRCPTLHCWEREWLGSHYSVVRHCTIVVVRCSN